MSNQLFNHINTFIPLSEAEFQDIRPYFELIQANKKQTLQAAGNKCTTNYFVIRGCLHLYFINDKGIERTVQFAIENWWITDFLAYFKQSISDFYLQAVEDSQLLAIHYERQEELLQKYPKLESYFRQIYQIGYGASLMKMKYLYDFSKEELYFHFTEHYPEFEQRVPQYLIASFLGLTPEYVSEIRGKKRS